MADNDSTDLRIGVSLDTSKLPQQTAEAESKVRSAVERTTAAVSAQGTAAEKTGRAHKAAADTAARAQRELGTQSGTAANTLTQGMAGGTAAVGGLTKALTVANGVMGVLTRAFGIIGLFNQVVASIQLVMDWWRKMNMVAESAGQKFVAAWRAQREEARLLAAQQAPLNAINAQIAAQETLLERLRETAALQAQQREVEARIAGNEDAVRVAQLDGALARGRISEDAHRRGIREVEDGARTRRQEGEMKTAVDALTLAQKQLNDAKSTHDTAVSKLADFASLSKEHKLLDAEGNATKRMEEAGRMWADAVQLLETLDGHQFESVFAPRQQERKRQAEEYILGAANALDVPTTKNGATKTMTDLAKDVMAEWKAQREKLLAAERDAGKQIAPGYAAVQRSEKTVDNIRRQHESENNLVTEKRWQDDHTRVEEARIAAEKAARTAAEAEAKLQRQQQREDAQQAVTDSNEREARLREDLATKLQHLTEAATEPQQAAMKALGSLLKRAEKEPLALSYLAAALFGGGYRTDTDAYKRYGQDVDAVAKGGLKTSQTQEAMGLIRLMMQVLRADARGKAAEGQVRQLTEQERAEAAATRAANVAVVREEASKQGMRAQALNLSAPQRGTALPDFSHLEHAADKMSSSADAAGGSVEAVARATGRMAEAYEKQAAEMQRMEAIFSRLETRMDRAEAQMRDRRR